MLVRSDSDDSELKTFVQQHLDSLLAWLQTVQAVSRTDFHARYDLSEAGMTRLIGLLIDAEALGLVGPDGQHPVLIEPEKTGELEGLAAQPKIVLRFQITSGFLSEEEAKKLTDERERRRREEPIRTLLMIAENHIARFIPDLTKQQRIFIRSLILDYDRRRRMQDWTGWQFSSLEQAMRYTAHDSDLLNWDWRPIITMEQTMLFANCFLAEQVEPGWQVKWLAQRGACRFCREMNGRVFTVVCPSELTKDQLTQVWVGKAANLAAHGFGPYSRVIRRSQRKPPVIPYCRRCRCSWSFHAESMRNVTRPDS